ncbi:hypothetical protein BOX15_Mlig009728g1 [Macrostomum lignano]|uniref:Protein kinase domain-containing protein n=1 Tax=Macrostomum lignano TaxID=282301 RepID=A0A267FTN8_9PLAT|nr:hypothetical protein BOX15_Mlig009728g1 [Macrostomum lignano]
MLASTGMQKKKTELMEALSVSIALHVREPDRLLPLCCNMDSMLQLTVRNRKQTVAHHVAQLPGGLCCLEALIEKFGPDCLTCVNEYQNTPVHLAAMHQDESWLELIHRTLGPDCFKQPGQLKRTAAHWAAMNEASSSSLRFLVEKLGPACLLDRDSDGATPAHLAAQNQDLDSFRLVVDSLGVSAFDLLDADGNSVADYMEQNVQHGSRLLKFVAELGGRPNGEEKDQEQKIQEQEIQEQEQKTQEQEQKTQEQEQKTQEQEQNEQPQESQNKRQSVENCLLTRLTLDSNFSSWQFVRDDDGCKQQIGSGGFGKVYKALTDKNQTVAVKIIKLAGAMTSKKLNKAVEKECAEIAVLRKLEHPNILKFLKYERTKQGKLCIFTELISGNSLSGLMQQQQKPFAEKAVRDFSQQICTALNFLHTRKPTILHRDIKGSNIMLTHKGRIKLIDFGLVKEITNTITDSTPHLCGTVFFMACELFTDTGKLMYSPKTDVWAFGCTVYELLTGKFPNGEFPWHMIGHRVRQHDMPQLPAKTSDSLRDFYQRCIEKEPSRRADTEELLSHEFMRKP